MPDLTELQRLAEGARADGDWFPFDFGHGYISRQDAAFMSAMSPDTAKKLIAVALAAQEWNRSWAAFQATQIGNFTPDLIPACEAADESLRTALEELK